MIRLHGTVKILLMTRGTGVRSAGKFHSGMTIPALCVPMLTAELELRLIMTEHHRNAKFTPPFRRVAIGTFPPECTVRRDLRLKEAEPECENQCGYSHNSAVPFRMTFVASGAFIDISRFSGMLTVHIRFIMLMTGDAGKDLEVGDVRMTIRTGGPPPRTVFVAGCDREERSMIECGGFPCRGGVTGQTLLRIIRRSMGRTERRRIIRCMTRVTIRRGPGKLPACMTADARGRCMRSRQGECCCAVIE